MEIANEETFGPVAPVQRIGSDQEALDILNAEPYGLASALFSRDIGRALRFAERARTGSVMINEGSFWFEIHVPFGGAPGKASGLGRANGLASMEHVFTETKTVFVHLG
jgi:acyl-CoA reductase-like NAD-dependent aldehyde dehydrogenase